MKPGRSFSSARLDDGSGTSADDSAGSADATLTGGATWSSDRGGSVVLDGSTGCLTTSGRVLVTDAGFTVSAWARLDAAGTGPQTVVSQDGADNNGFALQYTGSAAGDRWSFTMPATGANGATLIRVMSTAPAVPGRWTHLVGSYDATGKLAELHVDGVRQGGAGHVTPWSAAGALAIGRGKVNGSPAAFFDGSVSDVQAYQRAVDGHDVAVLHGTPVPGIRPGLGALSADRAHRTIDRTVLGLPALRTVIVNLGASDLLAGRSTDQVQQSLTALMHVTSPTGLRNSRRTDGTPVHVIVTTVLPLGLDAADPRELRRQQLNGDLLTRPGDYGAQEIVDLASVVQDPANPNRVNPVYLTDGLPNAAYHDAIAQAIADAASRFPPEASL